MTARELPPGRYGFDDVGPGDWIDAGQRVVTESDIDAFADLTGDRFEIHMDAGAAQRHGFDGRVAHGLLVLSLIDGMKNRTDAQFKAQASLGWDWRFRAPVLAGDTITVRIGVADKTAIRDPARGILHLDFDITNQNGQNVQDGRNRLMVYR